MPDLQPTPSAQLTRQHRLRHALNWVNGSTLLGHAVARLGKARVRRGPWATWIADHYAYRFPIAGAFTVGDVIITRHDMDWLCARRPGTMEHEVAHSRQWMVLGPAFLPAYIAAMGWSWLRTGDCASFNPFEQHADLEAGGYRCVPASPVMPRLRRLGRQARDWAAGRLSVMQQRGSAT